MSRWAICRWWRKRRACNSWESMRNTWDSGMQSNWSSTRCSSPPCASSSTKINSDPDSNRDNNRTTCCCWEQSNRTRTSCKISPLASALRRFLRNTLAAHSAWLLRWTQRRTWAKRPLQKIKKLDWIKSKKLLN